VPLASEACGEELKHKPNCLLNVPCVDRKIFKLFWEVPRNSFVMMRKSERPTSWFCCDNTTRCLHFDFPPHLPPHLVTCTLFAPPSPNILNSSKIIVLSLEDRQLSSVISLVVFDNKFLEFGFRNGDFGLNFSSSCFPAAPSNAHSGADYCYGCSCTTSTAPAARTGPICACAIDLDRQQC